MVYNKNIFRSVSKFLDISTKLFFLCLYLWNYKISFRFIIYYSIIYYAIIYYFIIIYYSDKLTYIWEMVNVFDYIYL